MLNKLHIYRAAVLGSCLIHGLQELLALQRSRLLLRR